MNALEEKMITPIKPESGKRWFAVFMVSLAITINYLDRVNFSGTGGIAENGFQFG